MTPHQLRIRRDCLTRFHDGALARCRGLSELDCPYQESADGSRTAWIRGWRWIQDRVDRGGDPDDAMAELTLGESSEDSPEE